MQDFDFYEIHEAFASQVLATLAAWESPEFCKDRLGLDAPLGAIDPAKLNVNGSSLAAGHPFAATGGRIVATLAKLLAEQGSGAGPHLHLRRRRPGRGGAAGAVSTPGAAVRAVSTGGAGAGGDADRPPSPVAPDVGRVHPEPLRTVPPPGVSPSARDR